MESGVCKVVEFNPDGSIKLPEGLAMKKQKEEYRLQRGRCVLIKKELVNPKSPKKCSLHITLSNVFTDNSFVERVYNYFNQNSQVPSKLIKINDKEFNVEIGTCFSRCRDCNSLVSRFRDHLDGNVIERKGSCTYEGRGQSFCYEDYFE
ncbi:hypothetical protein ACFLZX_01380 [Nanoarchaeota archaeon]